MKAPPKFRIPCVHCGRTHELGSHERRLHLDGWAVDKNGREYHLGDKPASRLKYLDRKPRYD